MRHLKMLPYFLVLLVISFPALADKGDVDVDSYDKCKAFDDGAIVEVPTYVEGADKPLHKAAVKLIKDVVCRGSQGCLRRNEDRLVKAAHTVVDVCLSEQGIPINMCLAFVAAISNEGGGMEHPTCGGLRQDCVRECDKLWKAGARQSCFVHCAIDQGIRRGSARWNRVVKCNDRGTSRGPFQMKKGRIAQCKSPRYGAMGPDFDPFSLEDSSRCTMRIVKRLATKGAWPCGRTLPEKRWRIAMKRVSRGVIRVRSKAKPGQWIHDTHGGRTWVAPTPRVVEQICDESGYAIRGLRYFRACGKACTRIKRYSQPPAPTLGNGDKISSKK